MNRKSSDVWQIEYGLLHPDLPPLMLVLVASPEAVSDELASYLEKK